MKKLILILLVIGASISAKAQNARNNASDNGVTLPVVAPQTTVPAIGVNSVNSPGLTVPTAPPVQVLSAPLIAPTPSISAPGVLPAVPAAPTPPPPPPAGTLPAPSTFTTTLNLPIVPVLPPIPSIPPMPDIRVPIGAN